MTSPETVASLFSTEPGQWGLRGDPYLWQAMRSCFQHTPLPPTADDLASLMETTFEALTGHPLATEAPFFVEQFNHGGMSGGHIAPDFWRTKVIPLLCARYESG